MLVLDRNAKLASVMNKIYTYLNSNLNLKKVLENSMYWNELKLRMNLLKE